MGNPAIFPLIYSCATPDVLIVHINPIERPEVPKSAMEILNRINEISFNSSLLREMRAIAFVTELIDSDMEMKLDLNRDGKIERIVNHPGRSEILNAEGGLAAVQLPEGLTFLDAQGGDTGLRLVDLNEDGFPDLILSNAERVEIRLWNKKVMPHLGWTPGWMALATPSDGSDGYAVPTADLGSLEISADCSLGG